MKEIKKVLLWWLQRKLATWWIWQNVLLFISYRGLGQVQRGRIFCLLFISTSFSCLTVKLLQIQSCEMKISPAVSTNKKCHNHQRFLPPNVNEGSQNCDPADAAIPLSDCWGARGMQEAAICHSLRWTRKQDLVPDSWGSWKVWIQWA